MMSIMVHASDTGMRIWKMLIIRDSSQLVILSYFKPQIFVISPFNSTKKKADHIISSSSSSIIDDDQDDEVSISKRCVEMLPLSHNRD